MSKHSISMCVCLLEVFRCSSKLKGGAVVGITKFPKTISGEFLFLITVFSRFNAGSVYLKLGLVDLAFIRTRRLFGARRLSLNAFFSIGSLLNHGDQTNTYYVTVSIYRTRQNSPTSQYVLFNKLSNIEPPPRRCTTARYVCLYIRKTDISPMYNGEVGASVYNKDSVSRRYTTAR